MYLYTVHANMGFMLQLCCPKEQQPIVNAVKHTSHSNNNNNKSGFSYFEWNVLLLFLSCVLVYVRCTCECLRVELRLQSGSAHTIL